MASSGVSRPESCPTYAGHMAVYRLHGIAVGVAQPAAGEAVDLHDLLEDLSFTRVDTENVEPLVSLTVRRATDGAPPVPGDAKRLFQAAGLTGYSAEGRFYLYAGSSRFEFDAATLSGRVTLTPGFSELPERQKQQFWAFGLLKLVSPLGLFGLHAAGIRAPSGPAVLIVGASGSGKSTLALGLTRRGWSFISDDSVVLRLHDGQTEALALRKPFAIVSAEADEPAAMGAAKATAPSLAKRRIDMREAFPERFIPGFTPDVILFSRIITAPHSRVKVLDRVAALKQLLEQSGLHLLDPATVAPHLAVLQRLLHQCRLFELHAGLDLYHDPLRLMALFESG